jgi:hypothetical protein
VSRLAGPLWAKHAVVLALALAATIPYGWSAVASLGLGGGIQIVNLRGLERSVSALVHLSGARQPAAVQALLALRLVLVIAIVGACLIALRPEVIPFVIGLSTVVPAVLWQGLEAARGAGPRGT